MISSEYYQKYKDWIDQDLMKRLDFETEEEEEESNRLREELYRDHGPAYILREDAPPEAIAAVIEQDRIFREAKKNGELL